ncbi:MAG: ECF RNA polymerase sigma-E factor [Bacteroidetes bacterium ADurb.Bin408]|nr:MAG: ECF RNA polymerase sigma-E factor [Bacteroidetes bacterium ADurb.Bin408]
MTTLSDNELLDMYAAKATKTEAFKLLVLKYQRPVYWHIRHMVIRHEDADDITQETFIKIWRHLDSFKRASKLYTWIYKIALNEVVTFLKRKNRYTFLSFNDWEKHLSETLADDNFFSGDAAQLKLHKAILTLPRKQRIIFNMKYFDNLSYEDISDVLKTSVGALKASYHHAVKKIEKNIGAF